MIIVRPLWAFSPSYRFLAGGHELATLIKPLSLIFFDHGRYVLSTSEKRLFEITVPRKIADYSGSREVAMTLLENERRIASLLPAREQSSTEKSRIEWNGRTLSCEMSGIGTFDIIEHERKLGTLSSRGFPSRERTIELPPEFPLEVQALIFLGTILPKQTEIQV